MIKKILETSDGNIISSITYDSGRNVVYAFSSSGDTYVVSEIPSSYGKFGPTFIFSSILDGNGDYSEVMSFGLVYDIYESVISANYESGYEVFPAGSIYSANKIDRVYGRYVSDVITASDGFGYWKTLSWTQSTQENSIIDVYIKVANSEEELMQSKWMYRYRSVDSYQYGNRAVIDLDKANMKGRFMMFMVDMSTSSVYNKPYVSNFDISYVGSHSVFFFSDTIKIESGKLGKMILTASMSIPRKTEIMFGVGSGGAKEWSEYTPINIDKLSNIPESFGKRFKVGARLSSYDSELKPTIHEFALSFDSPTNNEVNQ